MPSFRLLLASLLATATATSALALPLETPAPTARHPEVLRPGDPQIQPCTHTINVTHSRLPTPPYWPWCEGPVETSYAATETAYKRADCHGCLFVTVQNLPEDAVCAEETATATEYVAETRTVYETLCSPTTALEDLYPRQDSIAGAEGEGDTSILTKGAVGALDEPTGNLAPLAKACSTTLVVPAQAIGLTVTVYVDLVAVTSKVPCGGCELEVSTRVGGMGPMIQPGVTATADVGMTTVYECED